VLLINIINDYEDSSFAEKKIMEMPQKNKQNKGKCLPLQARQAEIIMDLNSD